MSIKSKMKQVLVALAAPALLAAAAPASAVLITQWDFTVNNGFKNWTQNGGLSVTDVIVGSGTDVGLGPTTLSWGIPSTAPGANPGQIQSSIQISPTVTGSVDSSLLTTSTDGILNFGAQPGDFEFSSKLTHNNFVQRTGSSELNSATLQATLLLTPVAPPSGSLPVFGPLEFNIKFQETVNNDPACPAPDTIGTNEGCQDIFVLLNPDALLVDGIMVMAPGLDDYIYKLAIAIDGLVDLTAAQCAAAGSPAGCKGLITQEKTATSFNVLIGIDGRKKPTDASEPGMLGLLGLSLAGLGFATRRRKD